MYCLSTFGSLHLRHLVLPNLPPQSWGQRRGCRFVRQAAPAQQETAPKKKVVRRKRSQSGKSATQLEDPNDLDAASEGRTDARQSTGVKSEHQEHDPEHIESRQKAAPQILKPWATLSPAEIEEQKQGLQVFTQEREKDKRMLRHMQLRHRYSETNIGVMGPPAQPNKEVIDKVFNGNENYGVPNYGAFGDGKVQWWSLHVPNSKRLKVVAKNLIVEFPSSKPDFWVPKKTNKVYKMEQNKMGTRVETWMGGAYLYMRVVMDNAIYDYVTHNRNIGYPHQDGNEYSQTDCFQREFQRVISSKRRPKPFILPVPVDDEYIKKIETWEKTVEVWDRDRVIVEDNWTPERLRALEINQMLKKQEVSDPLMDDLYDGLKFKRKTLRRTQEQKDRDWFSGRERIVWSSRQEPGPDTAVPRGGSPSSTATESGQQGPLRLGNRVDKTDLAARNAERVLAKTQTMASESRAKSARGGFRGFPKQGPNQQYKPKLNLSRPRQGVDFGALVAQEQERSRRWAMGDVTEEEADSWYSEPADEAPAVNVPFSHGTSQYATKAGTQSSHNTAPYQITPQPGQSSYWAAREPSVSEPETKGWFSTQPSSSQGQAAPSAPQQNNPAGQRDWRRKEEPLDDFDTDDVFSSQPSSSQRQAAAPASQQSNPAGQYDWRRKEEPFDDFDAFDSQPISSQRQDAPSAPQETKSAGQRDWRRHYKEDDLDDFDTDDVFSSKPSSSQGRKPPSSQRNRPAPEQDWRSNDGFASLDLDDIFGSEPRSSQRQTSAFAPQRNRPASRRNWRNKDEGFGNFDQDDIFGSNERSSQRQAPPQQSRQANEGSWRDRNQPFDDFDQGNSFGSNPRSSQRQAQPQQSRQAGQRNWRDRNQSYDDFDSGDKFGSSPQSSQRQAPFSAPPQQGQQNWRDRNETFDDFDWDDDVSTQSQSSQQQPASVPQQSRQAGQQTWRDRDDNFDNFDWGDSSSIQLPSSQGQASSTAPQQSSNPCAALPRSTGREQQSSASDRKGWYDPQSSSAFSGADQQSAGASKGGWYDGGSSAAQDQHRFPPQEKRSSQSRTPPSYGSSRQQQQSSSSAGWYSGTEQSEFDDFDFFDPSSTTQGSSETSASELSSAKADPAEDAGNNELLNSDNLKGSQWTDQSLQLNRDVRSEAEADSLELWDHQEEGDRSDSASPRTDWRAMGRAVRKAEQAAQDTADEAEGSFEAAQGSSEEAQGISAPAQGSLEAALEEQPGQSKPETALTDDFTKDSPPTSFVDQTSEGSPQKAPVDQAAPSAAHLPASPQDDDDKPLSLQNSSATAFTDVGTDSTLTASATDSPAASEVKADSITDLPAQSPVATAPSDQASSKTVIDSGSASTLPPATQSKAASAQLPQSTPAAAADDSSSGTSSPPSRIGMILGAHQINPRPVAVAQVSKDPAPSAQGSSDAASEQSTAADQSSAASSSDDQQQASEGIAAKRPRQQQRTGRVQLEAEEPEAVKQAAVADGLADWRNSQTPKKTKKVKAEKPVAKFDISTPEGIEALRKWKADQRKAGSALRKARETGFNINVQKYQATRQHYLPGP